MKKSISTIREQEGNEKSISIIRERESEAFILGDGREREFPLIPDFSNVCEESEAILRICHCSTQPQLWEGIESIHRIFELYLIFWAYGRLSSVLNSLEQSDRKVALVISDQTASYII